MPDRSDHPEKHVGVWVGAVCMVAGLFMTLVLTKRDAFALGGAGLLVAGALAIAVSIDDSPEDTD